MLYFSFSRLIVLCYPIPYDILQSNRLAKPIYDDYKGFKSVNLMFSVTCVLNRYGMKQKAISQRANENSVVSNKI